LSIIAVKDLVIVHSKARHHVNNYIPIKQGRRPFEQYRQTN